MEIETLGLVKPSQSEKTPKSTVLHCHTHVAGTHACNADKQIQNNNMKGGSWGGGGTKQNKQKDARTLRSARFFPLSPPLSLSLPSLSSPLT